MKAIIVLILTTWDCNTGLMLQESKHYLDSDEPRIDMCRRVAVQEAHIRTAEWRAEGYENASTNVDCHWDLALTSP